MQQLALFSGKTLRDQGMKLSVSNAGELWALRAYGFLLEFVKGNYSEFLIEQVREYAYAKGLERPPSERAWGAISRKAVINGVITKIGYSQVTNTKAHCTPAGLWKKT